MRVEGIVISLGRKRERKIGVMMIVVTTDYYCARDSIKDYITAAVHEKKSVK